MRELPRYDRTVSAARRRPLGAIFAMALLFAVAGVAPAAASERVHLDVGVVRGEEGSAIELARLRVAPHHVGRTCTVAIHYENQSSVHSGNDLLISTGDSRAVIADVEAVPDSSRDLSDRVVLGENVIIQLRFGPDQVSSMGFELDVDCGTDETVLSAENDAVPADPGDPGDTIAEVEVPPPALPEPCEDMGGQPTAGAGVEGGFTLDESRCPAAEEAGTGTSGDRGDSGPESGEGSGTDSGTSSGGPGEPDPSNPSNPSDPSGDHGQGTTTSGTTGQTAATGTGTGGSSESGGTGSVGEATGQGSTSQEPGRGPTATVLGVQQLPGASPAVPVQADPSYAG